MKRNPLMLAITSVALAACGPSIKLAQSIPGVKGDVKEQYTMRYLDIAPGTGAAADAEKCIYAHYTGWLVDGKKFDSSRDTTNDGKPRTPIAFRQGARQVIPGWDAGFEGMRVGGQRRLFIPYQIAYGEKGRPPGIPGKSMLVFDVELMDVTDAPPIPQGTPANQVRCKSWDVRRS